MKRKQPTRKPTPRDPEIESYISSRWGSLLERLGK